MFRSSLLGGLDFVQPNIKADSLGLITTHRQAYRYALLIQAFQPGFFRGCVQTHEGGKSAHVQKVMLQCPPQTKTKQKNGWGCVKTGCPIFPLNQGERLHTQKAKKHRGVILSGSGRKNRYIKWSQAAPGPLAAYLRGGCRPFLGLHWLQT